MPWIRPQAGQQDLELPGQLASLLAGESGQQGFLVPEEPVHAALDERVARRGQGHMAEPAVGVGTLAADQALALGPGWRANLDANLMSAVLVTAALRSRFAADARIVSLSSIAARRGAGSYGAAKAAVEAWSADVARELGPRGITANVVSPGLTLGSEFFQGTLTEERKQRLIAETRTGRPGTTEDVAAVVTFLASPSAGHLTGQVIHVNGGAYLGL